MNLRIDLKPNTNPIWFYDRLLGIYLSLKDHGIISDIADDGGHIYILVSVNDEEAESFKRDVILISPQVVSVKRA